MKLCRSCNTEKPLSEFGERTGPRTPGSRKRKRYPCSSCKECVKAKTAAWRTSNRAYCRQYMRDYRERGWAR